MDEVQSSEGGRVQHASRWILAAMAVLIIGLGLAATLLRPGSGPVPPEIAGNPRLVAGREIYLSKCVICHGVKGHGDGTVAKNLAGPPPRNFAQDEWKHGTRADQVLTVLNQGVAGTAMGGWSSSLSQDQMRSVAAYVYTIAGKPVPPELQ